MLRNARPLLLAALISGAALPAFAQSSAPVGVPECDSFLSRYDQCLNNNVPTAQRAQVSAAVTQMRDAWRQAAQNPQARAALGPQCTQMAQTMAQSMAAYGCQF